MLSSGGRRIFQGCVRPQKLMSGGGGGGGISTLFQTQNMGIIGYRGTGPAPTWPTSVVNVKKIKKKSTQLWCVITKAIILMSENKYSTFWQIWILQILSFKSIYNLPYFIARKIPPENDRKLKSCMAQLGFPSVFLTFGAFMISDFMRVTW